MRLSHCVRWVLPALMLLLVPAVSFAGISISVTVAPPILPVYEQPPCPEEGWLWSPGYWAYGDDGYYWVPGEWVPAPYVGALWTPPWWGWDSGRYSFHEGYWGDRVGYYGGIDYGYGYMGVGFVGGEWRGRDFAYNTAVMRVNTTVIRNTYVNETIVRTNTISNERHVAFNGGPNGVRYQPSPVERTAMSGRHVAPTSVQQQHIQAARADRTSYAKVNGGRPHTLAVARPLVAGNAGAPRPNARETARPGAVSGGREASRPGTAMAPVAGRTERISPQTPTSRGSRTPEPRGAVSHATPESRTAPASRTYPETRTAPSRTAERPNPSRSEPRTTSRPAPAERTRPEAATAPRTEPRPESRVAPPSRTESRPAPSPRSEPRYSPAPRPESRPASPPRTESRPAPEPRSAPQRESRPAPEPRSAPQRESRPAPPQHAAPAERPAPQHEARPAAPPRQEKPRPESQ